jgi:hypothetical protein
MPDHGGALRRARPVLAGAVLAGRKGRAVSLRAREHVVAIRRVAGAVDDLALFGERGLLGEVVAGAVEVGDILGDHDAFRILPRPLADAVARVHRRLTIGRLGRQIGAPGFWRAKACGLGQALAVIVGAGEPAKIAAIADAVAGQEKAGAGRLRLRRPCGEQGNGGKRKQRDVLAEFFIASSRLILGAPLLTRRMDHYSGLRRHDRAPQIQKAPRHQPQRSLAALLPPSAVVMLGKMKWRSGTS